MPTINPYLNFNGTCEPAMEFYRSVFGGEFAVFSRFGDMDTGMPVADEEKNHILHASLPIGDNYMLMASDLPELVWRRHSRRSVVDIDRRRQRRRSYTHLQQPVCRRHGENAARKDVLGSFLWNAQGQIRCLLDGQL